MNEDGDGDDADAGMFETNFLLGEDDGNGDGGGKRHQQDAGTTIAQVVLGQPSYAAKIGTFCFCFFENLLRHCTIL